MKDTATRAKERQQAEARRMAKEAAMICIPIILICILAIFMRHM